MTQVQLSEVVRNYGILVGGLAGLAIALWRGFTADRQSRAAAEQTAIGRRAHVTEVFKDAVGQLGHERLEIRLGAIYALKQIADDFPDFSGPVLELLSAYVREQSVTYQIEELPVDIREILEFLRRRI